MLYSRLWSWTGDWWKIGQGSEGLLFIKYGHCEFAKVYDSPVVFGYRPMVDVTSGLAQVNLI